MEGLDFFIRYSRAFYTSSRSFYAKVVHSCVFDTIELFQVNNIVLFINRIIKSTPCNIIKLIMITPLVYVNFVTFFKHGCQQIFINDGFK